MSQSYARTELMKHMPWNNINKLPSEDDMINQFHNFIQQENCPLSVKLSFQRSKLKTEQLKRGFQERVVVDQEDSNPVDSTIDQETSDALQLTQNLAASTNEFENIENDGFDVGKNYNWSKCLFNTPLNGDTWLNNEVQAYTEDRN
ncbi:MAG: hypothetical protein ACKPKO_04900, partial [Candidatus Fonsibacter sp.]